MRDVKISNQPKYHNLKMFLVNPSIQNQSKRDKIKNEINYVNIRSVMRDMRSII